MQSIADDLCYRAIMRKHDIRHAREIVIEKRPEHVGFECLHQGGEACDVGKQRCDFAALPAKINCVRIAGKPLRKVGGEVARQRSVGSLGRRLPPPCLAQDLDMPDGLGDRRFEIDKIDRLGQEIERAAVHRGANVGHVAIGRDDDGRELLFVLLQLLKER